MREQNEKIHIDTLIQKSKRFILIINSPAASPVMMSPAASPAVQSSSRSGVADSSVNFYRNSLNESSRPQNS